MATETSVPLRAVDFDLLERIDFLRLDANRGIRDSRRADLGQFMTPAPIARMMASFLTGQFPKVRLLDAGAGIGSLFAAAIAHLGALKKRPESIEVTAYEVDDHLADYISESFRLCADICALREIEFRGNLIQKDFVEDAVEHLEVGLFHTGETSEFNCAVLNPPYRKIQRASETWGLLHRVGVETTNLYTAFVGLAIKLLEPQGEFVAITPRSFCNGSYFRPFRELLLRETELRRIHVFESRTEAFGEDGVLQENVIFHAIRKSIHAAPQTANVTITSSSSPDDDWLLTRQIPLNEVVRDDDPERFIHIVPDDGGEHTGQAIASLVATLPDLRLTVSTGRVVDFRAKEHLRTAADHETAPLIWPAHMTEGNVVWPKAGVRKPEAIVDCPQTANLLVPQGNYVLVRRFSAKEERRRVVAAVYDSKTVSCEAVGFENHLNYYHRGGRGIELELARGLAAFLNSTVVDAYLRQFNGHTQVNAADLRKLRYPSESQLRCLGAAIGTSSPDEAEIDRLVSLELEMVKPDGVDPIKVRKRIDEALEVLKALQFPRAQTNERSALTLLALLDLRPTTAWSKASDPLCGITPMMDFFRDHYGKTYKPNTRETVRRQTIHQFVDAGLVVQNPDAPARPVNSPKAVYQIEPSALNLLRTFKSRSWKADLQAYLSCIETLRMKYAQKRAMTRLPVTVAPGKEITLSPGGQSVLVKEVIDQFAPRFVPAGQLLYVGDTDEKFAYFDETGLQQLGITLEQHGKMPDVILHCTQRNWLLLIEAVTSHGPIDPKRQLELKKLFSQSKAGLVFVTAFLTRKTMVQYLDLISWETEVWVAESPSHMIHFDGKRFLGPF